jgi:adenylyltransferase/sulfurtransferase
MEQGKTPTTPTIASIIAGVQCQEAVKLLHGMDTIAGRGWTFNGISGDSYLVEYQAKEDCLSHEKIDKLITIDAGTTDVTAGYLLAEARQILGPDATLELARDVLKSLDCPNCGESESVNVSLGKVQAGRAYCPKCTDVRRDVRTFYRIDSQSDILDRPLAEIGVPPWDIVMARAAGGNGPLVGFELAGDQENVFNSESPRK